MTRHFRKAVWVSLLTPWLMGASCQGPHEQRCDDGVDDDEDGFIDCDDPDCNSGYQVYYGYCPGEETDCDDGVDNDDDTDEDCDDSDCDDDPICEDESGTGGDDGLGGDSSGGASSDGGTLSSGGSGGSTGGSELGGGAGEGGDGPTETCPTPIPAEEGVVFADLGLLTDFDDFTQSSCQSDGSGLDIVVSYTPLTDGTLTVSVYSTYSDLDVSARSDCADPDSELPTACVATASYGAVDSFSIDVDADQPLFILVSGTPGADDAHAYLTVELE